MIVTAQQLRELGATNVISISDGPAIIVNNGCALSLFLVYQSLEEIKLAKWFESARGGGMIIVYDGREDDSESYIVRLFDFSGWKKDWEEDAFSALNLHRMKHDGTLKIVEKHETKQCD